MGRYSGINLAVFGDYMLDRWIEPSDVKMCPGQAVPDYISPFSIVEKPGGAGNQVMNVLSLGAECSAFGIWGGDDDPYGYILSDAIGRESWRFLCDESFTTHYKEYYEYQGRLLSRVSNHDGMYDVDKMYDLVQYYGSNITKYDGLIIADYNKGSMSEVVIRALMSLSKIAGIPVFVDPKFDNWKSYAGATIFKCNKAEWLANHFIVPSVPPYKNFVITCGEDGMDISQAAGHSSGVYHIPAVSGKVFDLNGAGDSVMAAMALEYIYNGGDIVKSADVGNIAGSICVANKYTYQVTEEDLVEGGAFV